MLAEWFKYGRKYEQTPKSITDLAKLGQAFIKWWVSLQPLARRVQGVDPSQSMNLGSLLIRPAKVEAGGWSRLSVGGKNGIFLVFLLLVWHKRLAESEQDLAFVELALYDVCWALDKVLEDLKTCERRGEEGEVSEQHKRSAEELEEMDESQSGYEKKARKKRRFASYPSVAMHRFLTFSSDLQHHCLPLAEPALARDSFFSSTYLPFISMSSFYYYSILSPLRSSLLVIIVPMSLH